jgi:protein-tyrosine-phosphatase
MAAGYLKQFSGGAIDVRSAGSEPADKINPVAVQSMAEEGIDIAAEQPTILSTDAVQASDVVITMGCGDSCPYYPGKRYEAWTLDDPAGQASMSSGPAVTRSASGSSNWSRSCLDRSPCLTDLNRTSWSRPYAPMGRSGW